MRRYPTRNISYGFGPGPLSQAIKALIIANVVMFLVVQVLPALRGYLGLMPQAVIERLRLWQPFTYMFLHGSLFHILFNMLALWMFGTELERKWGTRFFLNYFFATGIAAGATTILFSLAPFGFADRLYLSLTIGASGAIYGLLLAYGLTYPDRPIYMYFLFPIPAKYFVMIAGAIAFFSSIGESGGGVAHITHLGGLVAGYAILRGNRLGSDELKYRFVRWRMNRLKRKFGVYSGGRDDWNRRIH